MKTIEEYIKEGLGYNTMVFDVNNKYNSFTLRLLSLMKKFSIKDGRGKIQRIYVAHEAFPINISSKLGNVEVFLLDDFTTYLTKTLGGLLASNDKFLILGITDKDKPVLGSC